MQIKDKLLNNIIKDLTILLTLKDRAFYTKKWLENNIFPDYHYLIADGSISNENQEICAHYIGNNVKYIKFPPDETYKIYIKKRLTSLSMINTKYVLYADNDDFILKNGINKILNEFTKSNEITLIQGLVGQVEINKNEEYKRINDWKTFFENSNSNSKLLNLNNFIDNYYSLWYSISEVKLQNHIFTLIDQSETENPYLVEEFQTLFCLVMAKIKTIPYYHYIRLANPIISNNKVSFNKYKFDSVLNAEYYKSFTFLVNELSKYVEEVHKDELFSILRNFQISKIENKIRLRMQILNYLNYKLFKKIDKKMYCKSVIDKNIEKLFL